jgi:hypothetical protein
VGWNGLGTYLKQGKEIKIKMSRRITGKDGERHNMLIEYLLFLR